MFTTPQKVGGGPMPFSSASRSRLKGLFANGIWNCNCDPRLPATQFQVKKEGPNKGRFFYTCQEPRDTGCGFFLWKEDGALREMGAVMSNTRFEQDQLRSPTEAARDRRTMEGHSAASNKFMADLAKAEEEEYGSFAPPPELEREIAKVADQADLRSPETPRKAKTSYLATPGSKRKREDDTLPTPVTGDRKSIVSHNGDLKEDDDVFGISSHTLRGSGSWDGNDRFGFRSPSATPSQHQEPTEPVEARGERVQQNYDISEEVIDLLRYQHIDEETMASLKELLNKHALKISGIAKGRDITRLALKAKDAKIAELQQKIAALEAERDLDKTIIRHFKSDMAQSVERRRGRGRGGT